MTAAIDTKRQTARIAEWMRAILLPGQVVEVRALDPYTSRVFATAEPAALDRFAAYAASLSGRHKGVYYTPNPLRSLSVSGKGGAALDADVSERRWLLADCDPTRPVGTNATEVERGAAEDVIDGVHETLQARGFKGLVVASSGNGWHLMVPVRLPNDDAAKAKAKRFLELLDERFGTAAARIDRKTFNAARIWKLPATLAMKGPETADRPHRYAKLVKFDADPHQFADANNTALDALLAEWGQASRKPAAFAAYAEKAFREEVGRVASAANGTLANTLYRSAAALGNLVGGGLLDRGRVEAALLSAVKTAGGTDERKERDTVRRGLDAGVQTPREPSGEAPRTTVKGAPVVPATPKPEPWEPPIPLSELPPAERFPVEVFPAILQGYVREMAFATESPIDFAGVLLLAFAGGAIGNSRWVRVTSTHAEPACVFAYIVGRPSSGKSPAFRQLKAPFVKAERRFRLSHKNDVAAWEKNTDQNRGPRPSPRRCLTDNATVESLLKILGENPRGVLLARGELSALIAGFNQYKEGGRGNDRETFLQFWDCETIIVDRKSNPDGYPVVAERPFVGVVGTIQPKVVDRLRRQDGTALDDGFLERFLCAYPEPLPAAAYSRREVSSLAIQAWQDTADLLLTLEMVKEEDGVRPRFLHLSGDGMLAWIDFTQQHADEVNAEDFPEHLESAWGKLRGYCLRFALILHLLTCACDGLCDSDIDAVAVERAAKLVAYFKAHLRRVGTALDLDPRVAQARKLTAWLKAWGKPRFTRRDLWRSLRKSFNRPEELQGPLQLLHHANHIRPVGPEALHASESRRGQPTDTYEVNPSYLRVTGDMGDMGDNSGR